MPVVDQILIDPKLWASSRAGARAGRGFRYQDASGALLAARIWAGKSPATTLIPEGLDDLTLHGQALDVRVQAKSRHDPRGTFSIPEIAGIITKSAGSICVEALRDGTGKVVVLLERPAETLAVTGWDSTLADVTASVAALEPHLREFASRHGLTVKELLASSQLVTISNPIDDIVALITARHGCPDAIARLAAHRLRFLVGDIADQNYLAPASAPATLGATDVEAVVTAVLALSDPGAMFPAIAGGLCEPVSFEPQVTPYFYEGVDVAPGHVASGLALDRPDLIAEIEGGLQRQRACLIAGPSGSGKSAAAWLFAYQNRHAVRWFRLRRAGPDDAKRIVQLARALEASPERPVGFVFDDVGRDLGGIWEAVARDLRYEPGVLLLGTIREEDLFLIGNLAATALARPVLDQDLAARIFAALSVQGESRFLHWREPFELSGGLLLEYSHLLTSGQRLAETIDSQVCQRLREERDDELAILQGVVPAARFGGAIDGERLRGHLSLSVPAFGRALARLVDEHALRIGADGSLTGLHQIRSATLYDALHRHLPRPLEAELAELTQVLRGRDFSSVLPQLIAAHPDADDLILETLAPRCRALPIIELAAVFHGLGLAVCDWVAASWNDIVEACDFDKRHSGTAFTFALVGEELDLPNFGPVNAAIRRFGEVGQNDLRTRLLELMGGLAERLDVTLEEYHELAAALVPIETMKPAPVFNALPSGDWIDADLEDVLSVAATIGEFGVAAAERFIDHLGGSDHLLAMIHAEVAWVTRPELRAEADGLVVASDVRLIGEPVQGKANDAVVRHCERLFAAVPSADFASSCMLGWDGIAAGFKDYRLTEKRLPRKNAPTPVRIAWNRAMLRAIQSRSGPATESGRANALAGAINELSEMLDKAVELYVRNLQPEPRFAALLSVRGILNGFIDPPSVKPSGRSARDQGDYSAADDAFDFVNSVTQLAQDLITEIERPLLKSVEAGKLHEAAKALLLADSWRWIETPPAEALETLSTILHDLDPILGDAYAFPDAFRRARLVAERTSRNRRARIRLANDARDRALRAAEATTTQIRQALSEANITATLITKPMDDANAPYWPRVDYAVLLPVDHLVHFMELAEAFTEIIQRFPDVHRVSIVPVREGLIVGALAGAIYSQFLPTPEFAAAWEGYLPFPVLEERAAAALAEAINVCIEISAVVANLDRDLNPKELAYAQELIAGVKQRIATLEALRDNELDSDIAIACLLVDETLNRVQAEFGENAAEGMASEIARMGNGEQTDFTSRVIVCRIGLLERDILSVRQAEQ